MSEQAAIGAGAIPQWDVADRMRKALREADIGVQEIADYLGVSRNTVGTWINGRIAPSWQTLRVWSDRTGVSLGWLAGGERPVLTAAGFKSRGTSIPPRYCIPFRDGWLAVAA